MVEDDHEPGARVLFHEVDDLWVETGLNRRVFVELVEAAVEVVQLESLPVGRQLGDARPGVVNFDFARVGARHMDGLQPRSAARTARADDCFWPQPARQ